MRDKIIKLSHKLTLPTLCSLCLSYHKDKSAVCNLCMELISPLGPACTYCALPLPDAKFLVCGQCGLKKPILDRVITNCRFDDKVRTLLHEFKYYDGLYLLSFLTSLLLDAKPNNYFTECLIPIPLHTKRLYERGFNQSTLLAKKLSRKLKIPCEPYLCKKVIHTLPQAGLSADKRKLNLKNTFEASAMPYKHVTLIDDLYTTGSTANELASTLKQQGVLTVDLWCCARATSEK